MSINMSKQVPIIITFILFVCISSVHAGIWGDSVTETTYFSDQRTFTADSFAPYDSTGVLTGYWTGFTISWDINNVSLDNMITVWSYSYTLSAAKKDISHFILELTDGTSQEDFLTIYINGEATDFGNVIEGPQIWDGTQGTGSPGWPESTDLNGIKFDSGGNPVTYSFTMYNEPVWGNFYANSGKDKGEWVFIHNNALGIKDFESDNPMDFIVRPNIRNSMPVVPEPTSSILFIVGGATFAYRCYKRKRKDIT
jgi:hypothetical protein